MKTRRNREWLRLVSCCVIENYIRTIIYHKISKTYSCFINKICLNLHLVIIKKREANGRRTI